MTAPNVRPIRIVPAGRGILLKPGGSAIASGVEPGPDTVKLDPFLYPPPFSTPINQSVNTPITGPGTIINGVAPLTIPNNCYGVISSIDLLLDSIVITSKVFWTFFINGNPVPGFNGLTILGRNGAASVSKSWQGPLRLLIPLGGTVNVTIQDVDGAPYTAGTTYYGWFFPQSRLAGPDA